MRKGFVLIESLIGALIIGMVSLFLAYGYGNSLSMMQHANDLHLAVNAVAENPVGSNLAVTVDESRYKEIKVVKDGKVVLNVFTK